MGWLLPKGQRNTKTVWPNPTKFAKIAVTTDKESMNQSRIFSVAKTA